MYNTILQTPNSSLIQTQAVKIVTLSKLTQYPAIRIQTPHQQTKQHQGPKIGVEPHNQHKRFKGPELKHQTKRKEHLEP